MKTEREKQLEINLLVEKIERISKKKVTFKEATTSEDSDSGKIVNDFLEEPSKLSKLIKNMPVNRITEPILNKLHSLAEENEYLSEAMVYDALSEEEKNYLYKEKKSFKESLKRNILKEGTWALPQTKDEFAKAKEALDQLILLKDKMYTVLGDDVLFDGLDQAISRAKELLKLSLKQTNPSSDIYKQTKKQLDEIKSCIPDLNDFYNKNINGDTLYSIIVKQTPTLQIDSKEAYLDFLNQINDSRKFDISWTLPKSSSGSFYTAFTDLDWVYEVEGLTSKEADKLINDFKL